jgi:hypothetical protein
MRRLPEARSAMYQASILAMILRVSALTGTGL